MSHLGFLLVNLCRIQHPNPHSFSKTYVLFDIYFTLCRYPQRQHFYKCYFNHNVSVSVSQRQRDGTTYTHEVNTADLDVLQFHCNNTAYGTIPPLLSLLRLSIEKHVKSDLFIVLPKTDFFRKMPARQQRA